MEFCQVFGRVISEFIDAGSAAEFYLLPLVDNALFVAHGAQVIVCDDAQFERVGFDSAG